MNLIKKFTLVLFCCLVLFGAGFAWLLSMIITENMLSQAGEITAKVIRNEMLSEFSAEELRQPKTGTDYEQLSEKISHASFAPFVTRIIVWNSDQQVVWSDDRQLVGKKFPDNKPLNKALSGQISAEVEKSGHSDHLWEKDGDELPGRILEMYVPVRFQSASDIDTVIEIYSDLDPLYAEIRQRRYLVWAATFAGLAFLFVVLYTLVHRASVQLAEQAVVIRQSEEKYRGLVQSAQDGIISIDHDGALLLANDAAAVIFDFDLEELPGKSLLSIFSKPDHPMVLDVVKDIFLTGTVPAKWKMIELDVQRQDGSLVPVELSLNISGQGQDAIITAIFRDISVRKEMENLLQQTKDEWEETFDIINDAITIHDADFNIIRTNSAALELLGESAEKVLSEKCFASYHGTDCPPLGCPSCETLRHGQPTVTEVFEPHLGKYIEIKALPRLDNDGKIIGLVHVVRDIDARKNAEAKAAKALEMAHGILEVSPFGIYVVNSKGLIDYVNRAMLKISGDDYEHFIGVHIGTHPTYRAIGLDEMIMATIKVGTSFFKGNVKYTSFFGNKTVVRNFTGIPFEEDGERKALVFVEDISARAEAEHQQKRLENQLAQAQRMESVGRLAGGVAHDFNNILTAILGFSELVMLRVPADSPLLEDLMVIKESGEKAAALTKQLLAFSRKQELEMKVLDINAVVDNMAKMLRRMVREDISLEFKSAAGLSHVMADPVQIEQILMNMAVNARDAMTASGSFTIETFEQEIVDGPDKAHVEMPAGRYVVLSISDSGSGMSLEVQEKIFEPFFTTKEAGKGTGLGLATVYGIVKQHNGYIYVQSVEGQGTTFLIYFPVCEQRADENERIYSRPMPTGSETILVVEDEQLIRKLISSILEPLGYRCLLANDGNDVFERFKDFLPEVDLVLTDIIMPGMNGHVLSERIVEMMPEMKIVYMSGYTDDVVSQQGVRASGRILVQKPLTPTKLALTVRTVLDS